MKIGLDARPLARPLAGIGRVMCNLVRELQRLDTENEYFLYSDREFEVGLENPLWQTRVLAPLLPLPGSLWLQTMGRRAIARENLDVFWGTVHTLPLGLPARVRKVLTMYDVVWLRYPETMSLYNRLVNRLLAARSVRAAERVMAISESTAHDLEELLDVPRAKVQVIQLGVGEQFRPHDPAASARHIAAKYETSEDYVLAVGTVEPRKNLVTLLEAMWIIRERHGASPQLLIAGASGWGTSPVHQTLARRALTAKEVKFLGHVPEEDLPFLYAGASAFVFPSLYEGFGLPLLEAMACGVPVVASNVSSVPEVLGEAGLLVDPHQPGEFADAIQRVRQSPDLRSSLRAKGLERARRYRWERTGQEVLSVLTETPVV